MIMSINYKYVNYKYSSTLHTSIKNKNVPSTWESYDIHVYHDIDGLRFIYAKFYNLKRC